FKITRISDKQDFWLHEQVTIAPDGPGRWQLTGVALDMTERHNAEEARKETEEQLQQILMCVDCLLWFGSIETDAHGEYRWKLMTPPSMLGTRLFGEGPHEVRPMDWSDLDIPERSELDRRSSKALSEGAHGYDQEFRLIRDGKTNWLHEQVAIRAESPGRWHAFGVITDITARRFAEQALAAEKERLAVTLRAMEEAVVTLDKDSKVQFMNQAAAKLHGAEAERVVGRDFSDVLAFVQAETGEPIAWSIEETLRNGLVVDVPAQAGLRGPQDKIYAIEGCCVPLRDQKSEVIGAVLVLRDVTDRQRLESKLQRASKLEAVGILAGGIAHDFNNILTAILGNLSLASLEAKGRKPLELYLKEAQNASVRARDLTLRLLTFAKGGDPVRSAVRVADIVEEAARFALRGSKVKCEQAIPMDLWFADADKGQLGQIVQNIVINAAQAMPEGGVVVISARNEIVGENSALPLAPGDYIQLSITDSGMGMAPEMLPKIFDPYFTTKKTGSGLGLATVYSIVRKHRGFIDVESELGHGTTFNIRLPALRERKAQPSRENASVSRKLSGRVLAMDDEASIRRLVSRLLTRMGLEVDLAESGEEAVEKYKVSWSQGRPYDLLLMDLTVPGNMGGCEALAIIHKQNPRAKAIVASGYSSDPVMANFRKYGFCAMVAKPYDSEVLLKAVQGAIEQDIPQM
ncbi:MAG: ATP-binding protein, partial [Opitutaceae bacterium]